MPKNSKLLSDFDARIAELEEENRSLLELKSKASDLLRKVAQEQRAVFWSDLKWPEARAFKKHFDRSVLHG